MGARCVDVRVRNLTVKRLLELPFRHQIGTRWDLLVESMTACLQRCNVARIILSWDIVVDGERPALGLEIVPRVIIEIYQAIVAETVLGHHILGVNR